MSGVGSEVVGDLRDHRPAQKRRNTTATPSNSGGQLVMTVRGGVPTT